MKCLNLLMLAIAFCLGCAKNESPNPKILRVNLCSEPVTLDPRRARDLNAITICRMLYEGLTRVSKNGNVELALANAVEISDDGLEYVFHLREAYWSNGDLVNSYDFAESWKSILSPDFASDIAYQLYLIKNGRKVKLGELTSENLGIFTPDSKTLIVRLEQPTPYFLEVCSMSSFYPVPRNVVVRNSNWAQESEKFVGNGPFLLKSWKHNDHIRVSKNPIYWESQEVKLQEIELCMLSNNAEIDMFKDRKLDWAGSPLSTLPVEAIESLKAKNQMKVSPLLGTYFFRVNTKIDDPKNALSNAEFRKALAMATPREAIATHILQGGQISAKSLVPPEMGLGIFVEESNSEKANRLIDNALNHMNLKREELSPIVISFIAGDRNLSIAQAIQKSWQEILGIEIVMEAVEAKVFYQRIKQKDFQLAAGSWIADFNDPINFLEVFKFKDGSTNNTRWEDTNYIDLLDHSVLCKNQAERKRILAEAEKILMDQMPIIPIYHYAMNFLQNDLLQGVCLSPIGQIDFRWAEINSGNN